MNCPASDSIDRVPGISVPSLKAKCPLTFAAGTVQSAPPASELIADQQDARWVLAHCLMQRFECGIVHDEALKRRLLWWFRWAIGCGTTPLGAPFKLFLP